MHKIAFTSSRLHVLNPDRSLSVFLKTFGSKNVPNHFPQTRSFISMWLAPCSTLCCLIVKTHTHTHKNPTPAHGPTRARARAVDPRCRTQRAHLTNSSVYLISWNFPLNGKENIHSDVLGIGGLDGSRRSIPRQASLVLAELLFTLAVVSCAA